MRLLLRSCDSRFLNSWSCFRGRVRKQRFCRNCFGRASMVSPSYQEPSDFRPAVRKSASGRLSSSSLSQKLKRHRWRKRDDWKHISSSQIDQTVNQLNVKTESIGHICNHCAAETSTNNHLTCMSNSVLVAGQCSIGGPGVPADQWRTTTMKVVTRACGSFDAITGEPGRFAPQLFAASPA